MRGAPPEVAKHAALYETPEVFALAGIAERGAGLAHEGVGLIQHAVDRIEQCAGFAEFGNAGDPGLEIPLGGLVAHGLSLAERRSIQ